jgi:hypothetical protein
MYFEWRVTSTFFFDELRPKSRRPLLLTGRKTRPHAHKIGSEAGGFFPMHSLHAFHGIQSEVNMVLNCTRSFAPDAPREWT